MVLFKKLHAANKKLASSKLFLVAFVILFLALVIGSLYIFIPSKDLAKLIPKQFNFFSKKEKINTLDPKYEQLEITLNKIIDSSKEEPTQAILDLEALKDLPELLENRKKYILMNLYQVKNERVMAFISANQISKDYLPKHVLYKKAMMAVDVGLEAVVLEELLYLTNEYPTEPKFEYELAKSYLRQSLKEEAQKHLLSIQKVFPDSEYALGADYYLANLSSDPAVTRSKLENYLLKSPEGNLANAAASQLLSSSNADEMSIKKLSNPIAISFYKQGNLREALKYFNPDLDRPELFLKAYSESLFETGNISKAQQALVTYLPRVNDKEKASELIEYLVKISSKEEAIQHLNTLKTTVLENVKDKVLWELVQKTKAKEDYLTLYTDFPESLYAAESMAKVFWQEYERDNYVKAIELSKKHWALYPNAKSHPFVAFWAAKIFIEEGKKAQADEILNKIITEHPHDFYNYRAKQILDDKKNWFKMPASNAFVGFPNWNWPKVYTDEEIAEKYGADVLELTKISQYGYLLESFKPTELDKKFKVFLEAKSGNYAQAIKTAFFSILTSDKPNHKDLLFQYAFPLAYADLVSDRAGKNQKVDPMLVHSLIRQESYYQKDIQSKVGAMGLMQVMPSTAKEIARKLSLRPPRTYDLLQPSTNITLGVTYMEDVFTQFENNMINAIASYNAGPGAVKSWMEELSFEDPDLYIENIPYEETRNYVKQVLNNYWVYRELYS